MHKTYLVDFGLLDNKISGVTFGGNDITSMRYSAVALRM